MKYVLQINTGSLNNKKYELNDIITRLEYITSKISVSKVIFGWFNDYEFNRQLVNYLKIKGIKSYFWLPVFAEITSSDEDKYIEIGESNKKYNKSNDDSFDFVCQGSGTNINFIISKFDNIIKDIEVDGVFLDRIRFKSVAVSSTALNGCLCDKCKEYYKRYGVDIDNLITDIRPTAFRNSLYAYDDPNMEKYMNARANLIVSQIERLALYFRSRGLEIGVDTFALSIAPLVGQDLLGINKLVDFIKPMYYYKTFAPAGIPFEINGLSDEVKECLYKIWGGDLTDYNSITKELSLLKKYNIKVSMGIDANKVKKVTKSNKKYVKRMINILKESNVDETVLSWDMMNIDSKVIELL